MVGYATTSSSGSAGAAIHAAIAPSLVSPKLGLEGLWVLEVALNGKRIGRGRIELGPRGTKRGVGNPFLTSLRGFLVGNSAMATLVRAEGRSFEYRFVDVSPGDVGDWTVVTECRLELSESRDTFEGTFTLRTFDHNWVEVEVLEGTHRGELAE